jgi:hypothetical protein
MTKSSEIIDSNHHWRPFLNACYIDSETKISCMELFLLKIDDDSLEVFMLESWKKMIEQMQSQFKEDRKYGYNEAGKRFKWIMKMFRDSFSMDEGPATLEDYKLLGGKAFKEMWKFHEDLRNNTQFIYSLSGFNDQYNDGVTGERLIEIPDWPSKGQEYEYYLKPLNWINKKLQEYHSIKETSKAEIRIKSHLSASYFVYLLQQLHEKRLISLPTNPGSEKEIAKGEAIDLLMSVFSLPQYQGKAPSKASLVSQFNKQSLSRDAKSIIDEAVNSLDRLKRG